MNISPTSLVDQYQLENEVVQKNNKELGQDEFLELMMAQLEFQDPMKPMDNGEFLGQMAQFSTVTGIDDMKKSLETLSETYSASQTLEATQLVGQEVLIENRSLELADDQSTGGSFELDNYSADVRLSIADSSGTVVRQIPLGDFNAGRHEFSWDGKNNDGKQLSAGTYTMDITALSGEEYASATVLTSRIIDSVEFGNGGQTTLNTEQGDVVTLSDIRQIRNAKQTSSIEQ